MLSNSVINNHLFKLNKSKFRSKFDLDIKEYEYINKHGLDEITKHTRKFIIDRLSPAFPFNDGKQTPFKNHPVFIAQHATATCCRKCMNKWYNIPKGVTLTSTQIDFAVDLIISWIKFHLSTQYTSSSE